FFQAEDGIRGFHVTGVQTCALPISRCWPGWSPPQRVTWQSRRPFADNPPPCHSAFVSFLAALGMTQRQNDTGAGRSAKDRAGHRSEERRVGKEGRSWRAPGQRKSVE